jgi:large subunit ribosomal protein L18
LGKNNRIARKVRHIRIRKKVSGVGGKPRLCVFRSLRHIYTQVIDDTQSCTLVSASTLDPEIRSKIDGKSKKEQAELVGILVAERAKKKGIETVIFDRGGYKYHGRVKSLAEAARNKGLKF